MTASFVFVLSCWVKSAVMLSSVEALFLGIVMLRNEASCINPSAKYKIPHCGNLRSG